MIFPVSCEPEIRLYVFLLPVFRVTYVVVFCSGEREQILADNLYGFEQLQVFQKTAALELIAKGIISKLEFDNGILKINSDLLPVGYFELEKNDSFLRGDAFVIITQALPKVEFNGAAGLKKRSGLMEYIYDVK